jgi:1,4-dihydroxy-2-naphthoate polyprenyltransferase
VRGAVTLRVLVVVGHPRPASLNGALAAAYAAGAREAGCEVEEICVSDLTFEPDVVAVSPAGQELEPDLQRARALIAWADHLVFVYPNWWGTMPARLKGFLDRILLPGFAFREKDGHYYGLLCGRTAELITTMDVPPPVYRWIQGAPGQRAMCRATLGLCGVRSVRSTAFARASHTDPETRSSWVLRSRQLGLGLARGPRTGTRDAGHRFRTWLTAVRPQFFPMTLLSYTIGALLATAPLSRGAFALGLVCVVALKGATVLVNDMFDRESDKRNLNWGPFTGGGRSLQEGGLDLAALRRGSEVALGLSALAAIGLLLQVPEPLAVLTVLVPFTVLALAYTAPPLKLSHRGLGEMDVALTHGPGVVVFAHVAQGGSALDPVPWLMGLVIGLAILPAILLSGIPDRPADMAAGKRTLAVQLGASGAAKLAVIATVLSALSAVLLSLWAVPEARWLPVVAIPHGAFLAYKVREFLEVGAPERRIDTLMATALLYIGWFVIVPLVGLL